MEIESLFSGTRWEILKALSQDSLSPMELADSMKTTSANISQQLRLLELGGLVKSEKTSNSDKGKPRVIYSLAADNAYLVLALPGYTDKKMLPLTVFHKFLMGSCFLENSEHHELALEVYQKIKDSLGAVEQIGAESQGNILNMFIVTSKQESLAKKLEMQKVKVSYLSKEEMKKRKGAVILYDKTK